MNDREIWEELQNVISEELLDLMDASGNQVPNLVVGINIHNNKKKVKNNQFERMGPQTWNQWIQNNSIHVNEEVAFVANAMK